MRKDGLPVTEDVTEVVGDTQMPRQQPVAVPRRRFMSMVGISMAATAAFLTVPPGFATDAPETAAQRPNILWFTCEDMSANLGCYGDTYARTPNLDKFAKESVRYTRVFATAPVCSPARSCLITGVPASITGTANLRSEFALPEGLRGFPSLLRQEGYYCSNNEKTDYNCRQAAKLIEECWDDSSKTAHWRGRKPGQPFFHIFNDMQTHQSYSCVWPWERYEKLIRDQLSPDEISDPAKAPVLPYYPDTPTVRRTVARYYDCITAMDKKFGATLKQIEEDGLAEETIVFFYSDHGAGMPRHKRLLFDSGMHVPLMIRFPKKYRHLAPVAPGRTVDRLVNFADLTPTVLNLAGAQIPESMYGRAFLGENSGAARICTIGARDRIDEQFDTARSIRDSRWLYIRNYMPHRSYNAPSVYPDRSEIHREITRLAEDGKLTMPAQRQFTSPTRPAEELYDTREDPMQLINLADDPKHAARKKAMNRKLVAWLLEHRDLGFYPEVDLKKRCGAAAPYDWVRGPGAASLKPVLDSAQLVGLGPEVMPEQIRLLKHADSAVRYWAVIGLHAQGAAASPAIPALEERLRDKAPAVRIEAAGALAKLGAVDVALPVLERDLTDKDIDVVIRAARTLELLGETARPSLPAIEAAYTKARQLPRRLTGVTGILGVLWSHIRLQNTLQATLTRLRDGA